MDIDSKAPENAASVAQEDTEVNTCFVNSSFGFLVKDAFNKYALFVCLTRRIKMPTTYPKQWRI